MRKLESRSNSARQTCGRGFINLGSLFRHNRRRIVFAAAMADVPESGQSGVLRVHPKKLLQYRIRFPRFVRPVGAQQKAIASHERSSEDVDLHDVPGPERTNNWALSTPFAVKSAKSL